MGFTKEELQEFMTTVSRTESNYFTPREGISRIRYFCSPKETTPAPFYEIHKHWYTAPDGSRKAIVCTARSVHGNRPCPICDYVNSLYKTNITTMVAIAKELRTSRQFVQWAFVKEAKDEQWKDKPYLVTISKTVMTQILDTTLMNDEDSIDIFDIKEGHAITLSKRKGDGPMSYIYTCIPATKPMDLTQDPYAASVKGTTAVTEQIGLPTEEEQIAALEEIKAYVETKTNTGDDNEQAVGESDVDTDAVEAASSIASMLNSNS